VCYFSFCHCHIWYYFVFGHGHCHDWYYFAFGHCYRHNSSEETPRHVIFNNVCIRLTRNCRFTKTKSCCSCLTGQHNVRPGDRPNFPSRDAGGIVAFPPWQWHCHNGSKWHLAIFTWLASMLSLLNEPSSSPCSKVRNNGQIANSVWPSPLPVPTVTATPELSPPRRVVPSTKAHKSRR